MAKCDLSIELDRPDRRYHPGEAVTGHVIVAVDSACRCDGLLVQTAWRTHGKGNVDAGAIESVGLFVGHWAEGDAQRYPFRLVAPSSPRASRGELVNVDLYVEATADIPWALDPHARVDILVVHADDDGLSVEQDVKRRAAERGGEGCLIGFLGLVVLGFGITGFVGVLLPDGAALGAGMIGGGIFALFFLAAVWRRLAERKVGQVQVEVAQVGEGSYRDPATRDELSCAVHVLARAGIRAMSATFVVREWVQKGSGSNKRTYTHMVYTTPFDLAPSGAPGTWAGRIPLPSPGSRPYSFKAGSNAVQWFVEIAIDIPSWPDWKDVINLTAKPRRAGAVGAAPAVNQMI